MTEGYRYQRIYCVDCKCVTTHYRPLSRSGWATPYKCIHNKQEETKYMFWHVINSATPSQKKAAISIDFEPNPEIQVFDDYPVMIEGKNGNGEFRWYLTQDEFMSFLTQGNLIAQEIDRFNIDKSLGGSRD